MAARPSSANSSRPTSAAGSTLSPTQKHTSVSTTAVSSTTTTPVHTPRKESSPSVSHRSSFAENIRNYPPSPRAQRTPSFSGAALTELLMNPPVKTNGEDAKFARRDWRTIQVQEIIEPSETRFVELDTSIEDTTKLLIRSGAPNVVLIRESRKTKTAIGTFGYDELNAYLLLVLGMSQPDESAAQIAERARGGETLALKEVNDHLGSREGPAFLPSTAYLTQAMEMLGSGLHRIVVCKEGTSEAFGILSQLRLVRFFWENHQNFEGTERLYARTLKELNIGAKEVLAINGDRQLSDALILMHDEGITSLPVLDSNNNVVGNISHVDVRVSKLKSTIHSVRATDIPHSCSQTPPPSHSSHYPASTSSPSSSPNAVSKTEKTPTQSSTSHPSARSPTPLPSSARRAHIACGSSMLHRRPQVFRRVPACNTMFHHSAGTARIPVLHLSRRDRDQEASQH